MHSAQKYHTNVHQGTRTRRDNGWFGNCTKHSHGRIKSGRQHFHPAIEQKEDKHRKGCISWSTLKFPLKDKTARTLFYLHVWAVFNVEFFTDTTTTTSVEINGNWPWSFQSKHVLMVNQIVVNTSKWSSHTIFSMIQNKEGLAIVNVHKKGMDRSQSLWQRVDVSDYQPNAMSWKIPDLFYLLLRCSWLGGLDPHDTTPPSSG